MTTVGVAVGETGGVRATPARLPSGLLDDLRDAVGATHVLVDADRVEGYVRDWTGRFVGATPAVVRPGSTAEVAAVLALCNRERVAVVAQGGNTGLVGGSVPLHGEVVVSLSRLREVERVDRRAAQVTAGAGATLADVQRAARAAGLAYGVDLGARDSATVGGTVAANAGGVHVVRYGDTRRQLAGHEAVLADGSVLSHLGGLVKDNTGYDLGGLLCGSEGTLAILTRARLRLVTRPEHRATALVGFDTVADAIDALAPLRSGGDWLHALEIFVRSGLELVVERFGLRDPFDRPHAAYLLVEGAGSSDPTEPLADVVAGLGAADVAVAVDGPSRAALWELRERHTEAINRLGPPIKLDVTLPPSALSEFVESIPARIAEISPDVRTWLFGHAGDGNIHVNVTGALHRDGDDSASHAELITHVVLAGVAELGGSISAEHGIGTAKRRYLHLCRSDDEIAAFRAIKTALDPNGILNPHVLLPDA